MMGRPTEEAAREAVRTLMRFAGDDPGREGLIDTPDRVVRAWGEWFSGYGSNPDEILSRTFESVGGYDEIVVLRGVRLESHCEHHLAPIVGTASIAYLPGDRVVGLSKLARVLDAYAKRLQVQERLTAQVADSIERVLNPRGVAVLIEASHMCTSTRGVNKPGSVMVTSCMRGLFRESATARAEVMQLLKGE